MEKWSETKFSCWRLRGPVRGALSGVCHMAKKKQILKRALAVGQGSAPDLVRDNVGTCGMPTIPEPEAVMKLVPSARADSIHSACSPGTDVPGFHVPPLRG
jgi:hypothetical protein